jgi:flavin reductase (DIM6/NTAB) family NADH-FMN oxidoreductase RutF
MPTDAQSFKAALGRFASGVTVVTVRGADGDHGMTASAFTSLSLDPPLVLVCVKKGNFTHGLLAEADGFAINILAEDQVSVSNRFAGWGFPPEQDKWEDLSITRASASGAALIGGCLGNLDCTKWSSMDGGDHTIFVGQVENVVVEGDRDDLKALLYFAGKYRGVGTNI